MNDSFGKNLRALRLEKELSQAELGRHLHKGQKTIGNWETGYSEPCIEDLLRIGDFFQVNVEVLLKQEIKSNAFKSKNGRIRHKEPISEEENFSLLTTDVKQHLQDSVKKNVPAENGEIVWRDKYIAVLENQLFKPIDNHVLQPTIQALMTQMLTIQKTLSELLAESQAV